MKFLKIHHPLETRDNDLIQEYYRERFYGGITLIALNATILLSDTLISPGEVIVTIIVTILSLWLASVLSTLLSYRVIKVVGTKHKRKILTTFYTHRGMLFSSIPCLVCVGLSYIGLVDLQVALIAAIVLSALRIIVTVVNAYDKNEHYFVIISLSIILQICVIGAIIALKYVGK